MTSNSSMKTTAKEVTGLISAILNKLTNPAGLAIAFLSLALLYLVANHQLIGASADLIYSYGMMYVLIMIYALYRKVPLERLDWRAKDLWKGKYIKSPRSIHWTFIIAFIAFLLTIIFSLLRYQVEKADIPNSLALEIAWQQLLVVSLSETVIFQGLFPLIVEWELETHEKKKSEIAKDTKTHYIAPSKTAILLTVIIVSQGLFAMIHYAAKGGDWWTLAFLFIPGTIWYLSGRYFGLQTPWLSHFAWNCVAFGLIGFPAAAQLAMVMLGG